jgi:class 3 adenylate cyclase
MDPIAVLRDPTLSRYREQLVEYLFLAELLRDGWLRRRQQIDVLRADVDGSMVPGTTWSPAARA